MNKEIIQIELTLSLNFKMHASLIEKKSLKIIIFFYVFKSMDLIHTWIANKKNAIEIKSEKFLLLHYSLLSMKCIYVICGLYSSEAIVNARICLIGEYYLDTHTHTHIQYWKWKWKWKFDEME